MSTFDDPNRQAVGLEPIWTGAGDTPTPQKAKAEDKAEESEPAEDEGKTRKRRG